MLSPRLQRTRWRCPPSSFVGPVRLQQGALRPLIQKGDNRVQVVSRAYSGTKVIGFPADRASPTKGSLE